MNYFEGKVLQMKRLLIMRHGKSNANKPGQEDIKRALSAKGHSAILEVANWMLNNSILPEIVLISKAQRTSETWQLIKNVIGKKPIIHSQEALYLAGANEILAQLSKINNNHNTALLIGHNPGLDILAQTLTGKGSNGAAAKNLQKGFPTAAMAIFKLKGNSWQNLTSDGAELLTFLLPSE